MGFLNIRNRVIEIFDFKKTHYCQVLTIRSLPGGVLVPFVGPRFAFRLRLGKDAPNAKIPLLPIFLPKLFGEWSKRQKNIPGIAMILMFLLPILVKGLVLSYLDPNR